ncbi:hypothetical protein [Amycolatopsis magusensis]|uniref:hypothetical protein n=1 Tax=Amycolatopsis magusensis TaxID=882444 RepID=UPI003791313F
MNCETPSRLYLDLERRAAMLARLIRGTPGFLDALRLWLGFELLRLSRAPDAEHVLDGCDPLLLDLAPGSRVLRREDVLVAAPGGPCFAEIAALIHTASLRPTEKAALRDASVPVSTILRDTQRSTHYVCHTPGLPEDTQPALRSRATLLRAGRPVALLWETVWWRTVSHRDTVPARLPAHLHTGHGSTALA